MSRRKQANPAKLGESDVVVAPPLEASNDVPPLAADVNASDTCQKPAAGDANAPSAIDSEHDDIEEDEDDEEDDVDLDVDEDDDDEEDDDGSLLNGQGGSTHSSSSDQASPVSSCPSSLSDVADSEEAFTMGATATTPYECNICKRAFARSSLLSKHVQTHTEQLQFSCPYCRRLFKHKRSRDRHTKLHTGDKKYKCLHCESAFARSDHLKIHMKTHDNKKPHQCELCNRGYNTAAALASHQQHHSKQEQRRCGSTSSRSSAASTPSPGSFRCVQCPETFEKAEALQNHLLVSHKAISASPVHSGQPPSIVGTDAETTNFMLKSPLVDLPKIACMYCGKDFLTMHHMYQHIHAEHRAIFNSISQNMSYAASLHSPGGGSIGGVGAGAHVEDLSPKQASRTANTSPTYACDRCTMRFDSSVLLQEHIENVHWTRVRPASSLYKYEYNEKALNNVQQQTTQTRPTDLSRKRRSDSVSEYAKSEKRKVDEATPPTTGSPYEANDKPCICSYCYAQMPNFKMFLLHMETHVAMNAGTPTIPPLSSFIAYCPLCGEPARSTLELGRHIFGHAIANVTAHCCHTCKKPFDKLEPLQKHLMDAHSQIVYKCTICNELFDNEIGLQMHFSNKHTPECKHYRCNLCAGSEQVFHDRLTAELHVNMKHSLQAPNAPPSYHLARFPSDLVEQQQQQQRAANDFAIFQCPFCQKIFKDEYLQYVHILKEHNEAREGESYLLDAASAARQLQYGKTTTPPDKLKHHHVVDVKPTNVSNYNCELCSRTDIASEMELAAHKKLHHSKTKVSAVSLQCAYCNEHCKSRADLENHMKSHQVTCGKGKHKCNICDEIFTSSATLAEHKLTHCKIVAGNSCTQCKTLLVDEQSFYNHQLQHSNHGGSASSALTKTNNIQISLPANCIICCQTLQTDVEIKLHAKFHLRHSTAQKDFICAVCNKLCDYSMALKPHENSRGLLTINICKDCSNATNGNSNNRSIYHSNNLNSSECKERNLFACLKCPQTFGSEDEIQVHAHEHIMTEEPNLECHLCRNVLSSPTKLQVHLIEHNFMGMGQYRCYVCSSVFTTASGLRSHIIGHGLNHRPYECTQCKMKFYFETELENHKYVHLHVKYSKNGELSYDKYIECKHCSNSIPEAYHSEHVRTCNNSNNDSSYNSVNNANKTASAETNDHSAGVNIINIKIEQKDDAEMLTNSGQNNDIKCEQN